MNYQIFEQENKSGKQIFSDLVHRWTYYFTREVLSWLAFVAEPCLCPSFSASVWSEDSRCPVGFVMFTVGFVSGNFLSSLIRFHVCCNFAGKMVNRF